MTCVIPESRRRFLRDAALLAVGGLTGGWLVHERSSRAVLSSEAFAEDKTTKVVGVDAEARLRELGLKLPPPGKPAATLVPAVRTGNLLFVSGHVSMNPDGSRIVGKVGKELTTAQGADAARNVALTILGVVRNELGSLNRVKRLVKVLGMVNCTPDYTDTPLVINGFSKVLIDLYGNEAGKGARSAVGMGSLPGGVAVEIEAIFELHA